MKNQEMDLPNDVVLEILSWLPLEKAGKGRALSKFLAKATHHSYYKRLLAQRQRRPILDGFISQTYSFRTRYILSFASPLPNSPPLDLSLTFLPGRHPKILAVAPNGLLLCQTQHFDRHRQPFYTICKPSTKQWKGLPLPRIRFDTTNTAIFVLRSSPLHFKIIRLSKHIRPKHPPLRSIAMCELFDSQSWRWKRLGDIVEEEPFNHKYVECHEAGVMASGSAHWKFSDGISVFAFHFNSETWSTIQMPDRVMEKGKRTVESRLVEYEGKLGVMVELKSDHEASTELWVMENYDKRTWRKRMNLVGGSMPTALYGSDISATWEYDRMKFCNLENGKCSYRKLEGSYYWSPRMLCPFLSDFEPWNIETPPRTLKPRTMAKILRKRLLNIQSNVAVLASSVFFFVHYNNLILSTFLLGMLHTAQQNF